MARAPPRPRRWSASRPPGEEPSSSTRAPGLQFKLLRLLEQAGHEHQDRPTGADQALNEGQGAPVATVHLVCATRRNLRALVEAGQFREDLYSRIGACRVTVPPLRNRREVTGILPDGAVIPPPEGGRGLTETIAGVERSLIDAALRRAAGNQAKAAQFLGIPRTTLRDKMAKHGMVGGGAAKGQPA